MFMSMLMFVTSDVRVLINYIAFAGNLMALVCISSFFWFRVKHPDLPRPIKVWIGFPIIYIVLAFFLCAMPVVKQPLEVVAALVILATGIPVYYFLVYREQKPQCLLNAIAAINPSIASTTATNSVGRSRQGHPPLSHARPQAGTLAAPSNQALQTTGELLYPGPFAYEQSQGTPSTLGYFASEVTTAEEVTLTDWQTAVLLSAPLLVPPRKRAPQAQVDGSLYPGAVALKDLNKHTCGWALLLPLVIGHDASLPTVRPLPTACRRDPHWRHSSSLGAARQGWGNVFCTWRSEALQLLAASAVSPATLPLLTASAGGHTLRLAILLRRHRRQVWGTSSSGDPQASEVERASCPFRSGPA
ncbi:Large neutral amino acids transporter small subunit 2 [Chionoecetes opilio]|uniref:Large neutral amino acids transporter small subunit 2 n=1 Tax=Chionoecetes opilio TaxID=41210 RepID=A0A8J4YMB0_CHIOP|nr:Large neutral amino acids transporter small subunit 2 [Chionoecetes opilio]